MRHGAGNGRQQSDMDDLQVYEGIIENIRDSNYTLKDMAEDYGKFEAVNLLGSGTIVDHDEREFNLRESRIPEADINAAYMNNGLKDAGKSAAYNAALTALPAATGYMAIESGGEPFWVFSSIFSTSIVAKSIANGAKQVVEGVSRRAAKKEAGRSYDFNAVAQEDYELNIVGESEFQNMALEYDDDEDVEVRKPIVMVSAERLDPETREVEEELSEDILEPEDDESE